MKARFKIDKSIIIIILIVLVAAAAVLLIVRKTRSDTVTEMIENGQDISVVFLFHDGETLLFTEVLLYNPETGKGALIDIPGETGVIIEKIGKIDRIDTLYNPSSPDEYINAVERMIEYETDLYIQISKERYIEMVDIIGGLELFIANPVEIIEDDTIALMPSGSIVFYGEKAETYISYYDPEESEIDRSGRREKTVQALLKAFQHHGDILVSEQMYPYFEKTIDTDMDNVSIKSFIKEMENIDSERIVFQRVLGVRRTVDNQELLFSHYNGNLLKETVRQTIESLANVDVVSDDELNITIEILNGTTVNGLASRTSQVFQSFGYDVAYIGNYEDSSVDKTLVIDRRGNASQAQRIASIIKCSNIDTCLPGSEDAGEIVDEDLIDVELLNDIDLTIILGKDFDGRYCKE